MLPVPTRRGTDWPDTLAAETALDRLLRPFWPDLFSSEGGLLSAYPVDIREEEGKLVVDAELPGFTREEIDISIERNMLRIKAERKTAETKGTKHLFERRFTRVDRSFALPCPVDESKVEAKLDKGVLHIELPETEENKAKHIKVK